VWIIVSLIMARHFQSCDIEQQGERIPLNAHHNSTAITSSSSASASSPRHEENHDRGSCMVNLANSAVFGGFDGLVGSLTVISGVIGAGLSWRVALVVGLANIVASSLFVGFSELCSSTAHSAFLQSEKRREIWEFNRLDKENNWARWFSFL
jgi:hypothetical protein